MAALRASRIKTPTTMLSKPQRWFLVATFVAAGIGVLWGLAVFLTGTLSPAYTTF